MLKEEVNWKKWKNWKNVKSRDNNKRQNAEIPWRNKSHLISIGKGKAFKNHRQYENNNKQDGRRNTFINQK